MIPIRAFVELAKALPKARLNHTSSGLTIYDVKERLIGHINMINGSVTIFDGYELSAQVREAIGEDKFTDARKEFDIQEPPVKITDDGPVLTDYGKLLYEGDN